MNSIVTDYRKEEGKVKREKEGGETERKGWGRSRGRKAS